MSKPGRIGPGCSEGAGPGDVDFGALQEARTVNRTFRQGLLSAATGLLVGIAYQVATMRTGGCADYFRLVGAGDGQSGDR